MKEVVKTIDVLKFAGNITQKAVLLIRKGYTLRRKILKKDVQIMSSVS